MNIPWNSINSITSAQNPIMQPPLFPPLAKQKSRFATKQTGFLSLARQFKPRPISLYATTRNKQYLTGNVRSLWRSKKTDSHSDFFHLAQPVHRRVTQTLRVNTFHSLLLLGKKRIGKTALSRALHLLVEQGYVRYFGHPEDERVKVWSVFESVELLHDRMLKVSAKIYEYLLCDLKGHEIDSLRHCLQVLSKKIDHLPEKNI